MKKSSYELYNKVKSIPLHELDEIALKCFTATEFAIWQWLRSESEENLSDIARSCNVSRQAIHFILKVFFSCGIATREMIESKARECKRRITFKWLNDEIWLTGSKKLMLRILQQKARKV